MGIKGVISHPNCFLSLCNPCLYGFQNYRLLLVNRVENQMEIDMSFKKLHEQNNTLVICNIWDVASVKSAGKLNFNSIY